MPDPVLDATSRRLLGLLQSEFPVTREPYEDLGAKLGIAGEEVISRIQEMKDEGIVRQISPVLDARQIGYQSTLVALKVKPVSMARAEQVIAAHPGISHGYEREHEFNIWVTLSVPPGAALKAELKDLSSRTGAEAIFALAAVRVFKLRTNFSAEEVTQADTGIQDNSDLSIKADLSHIDRKIVNELQQDLPLYRDPFAPIAASLGICVDSLLNNCRSLLRRGIIRRYGASINHYNAGYKANAMTCWSVPANRVELIGRKLAELKQVSHCYEREINSFWHYNLFAMVHSQSKAACLRVIEKISSDTGISDYAKLFSIREFKKTRIQYRV